MHSRGCTPALPARPKQQGPGARLGVQRGCGALLGRRALLQAGGGRPDRQRQRGRQPELAQHGQRALARRVHLRARRAARQQQQQHLRARAPPVGRARAGVAPSHLSSPARLKQAESLTAGTCALLACRSALAGAALIMRSLPS